MRVTEKRQRGFTLNELAVVLVIIGFLVGGLLLPLATQVEQRNRRETEQQLEEIRQALLGYVVANGYLPCPAKETNPAAPDYGVEARLSGICARQFGILPWKTLGVRESDAWGQARAAGNPWLGYFRYHVHDRFSDADPGKRITLASDSKVSTPPADPAAPLSVMSAAGPLTAGAEPPVAVIYSTGPDNANDDAENLRADGGNEDGDPDADPGSPPNWDTDNVYQGGTPTAVFNDLTIWISRPVLFEKLVSAGRVP